MIVGKSIATQIYLSNLLCTSNYRNYPYYYRFSFNRMYAKPWYTILKILTFPIMVHPRSNRMYLTRQGIVHPQPPIKVQNKIQPDINKGRIARNYTFFS